MSERYRRGGPHRDERRESREFSDRPNRRYPDENYGGDREANRSFDSDRDRNQYYGERNPDRYRGPIDRGNERDYNRSDYRGDFGSERPSQWQSQKPGHARENYQRDDSGWSGRGDWGHRAGETWQGGRSRGGYGSEFGSWGSGAGFGFGPEENPDGGFEDTDWAPNRPARGRGVWAGDWGESAENYRGRGPKDYRRSDDRIREEVCDRLTDDPAVDAGDVTIKVENGEVVLSGTVPTREQKWRAEACAERIAGVRDVINQLRINRGEMTSPSTTPQTSSGRSQRGGATTPQAGVAADRERS